MKKTLLILLLSFVVNQFLNAQTTQYIGDRGPNTNASTATSWAYKSQLILTNTAPDFTSTPVLTVYEGDTYTYNITTTDADADNVSVTATTLPSWLTLTTESIVSTLAGNGTSGFVDGTGTTAQFDGTTKIALDASGNTYVADSYNHRIRKITPLGVVSTFAGTGVKGYLDGAGTTAQFNTPNGIAVDASGNVYVADFYNHSIRKITPSGVVSTFAGTGIAGYLDGAGTIAQFKTPKGLAVDVSGNVYVAEQVGHRIRKITSSGVVSTLAGTGVKGYLDGSGTTAQFYQPTGVAVDASGNVYVADALNNRIRKITSSGVVSTLAGTGTAGFLDGAGITARFDAPRGVAVDASGNVYVADFDNHRIRKITSAGVVSTFAGTGTDGFLDGAATIAQFDSPAGIAVDVSGSVYVADFYNNRIRKINTDTITLSGDSTGQTPGDYPVTLQASDGTNTVDQNFTITIIAKPEVTASPATSILTSEATFNGEVTADVNDTIIERGFIYALTSNDATPTLSEVDGTTVIKVVVTGSTGTFNTTTTGLTENSNYSYIAYVTNNAGTTESNIETFTTKKNLPIFTQIYHADKNERWIEVTNASTLEIPANNVNIALYKDKAGDQTGIVPDAEYTINTAISIGASYLIRKNTNAILSHIGTTVEEANITDFDGANDILIITSGSGTTAWANRYDVVSNIEDEASYVRNDNITSYNSTYTASEWTYFSNDITDRHENAPLLSDIASAANTTNLKLGTHYFGSSIYETGAWSNGSADITRSIIIDDDYEYSSQNLLAREATINSGKKLTVINVGFIIADELTINAGAEVRLAGTAQLIQTHTGSGLINGTGKLYVDQNSLTDDTYRYNFFSSPVNTVGATTFSVADVMKDGSTATSSSSIPLDITFTTGYDGAMTSPITISERWLYTFANNADYYVERLATDRINQTEGYTLKGPGQAQNYTFVGTPNDGAITSVTVMGTNEYYLTGNPYPSALNAEKFIEDNKSVIDGTLYFWEHIGTAAKSHRFSGYIGGFAILTKDMGLSADNVTSNNTDTSNGTPYLGLGIYQEPQNYIPVGQGFLVSTSTGTGSITFNNNQRAYVIEGATSVFFKTAQNNTTKNTSNSLKSILKLGIDYISDNGLKLHKQLGMVFNKSNTFEYDPGHDAISLNEGTTDVYWKFPNDANNYVIAGVPEISDALMVPLDIKIGDNGNLTFTIDEWQNIDREVYLLDTETNTTQPLSNGTATVSLDTNTLYTDRFVISFVSKTLSTESLQEEVNNITVTYLKSENTITVNNYGTLVLKKLELYSLIGVKVRETSNSSTLNLGKNKLAASVYILKITTDKGIISKKIFLD